jgi:phosphatidate cytidylyltransferase
VLATRVASAAVFGPLLVAAAFWGGPLLWTVTAVIVVVGLWEIDRLFRATGSRAWPALTVPFGLALVTLACANRADLFSFVLVTGVLTLVFVPALVPSHVKASDAVSCVFALVYVPWLASHFILLRQIPGGVAPFFVGLIGTWVFDAGSYFIGKAWGRHKLAPRVSPGKSVEGLVGGVVCGAAVLVWLGLAWLRLSFLETAVLALAIMSAAQLGDLAESTLKRHSGVKDSGTLIPGHGGVLDRFDSLLAVMPVVYYLWVLWLGAPA